MNSALTTTRINIGSIYNDYLCNNISANYASYQNVNNIDKVGRT